MSKENYQFATLTDKELDQIRETEKALNHQSNDAGRSEDIILLAYKPNEEFYLSR